MLDAVLDAFMYARANNFSEAVQKRLLEKIGSAYVAEVERRKASDESREARNRAEALYWAGEREIHS